MQIWSSQVLEKAGVSKKMKLGNNLYMHNYVAASATCMKRKRQERKATISNEELYPVGAAFLVRDEVVQYPPQAPHLARYHLHQ